VSTTTETTGTTETAGTPETVRRVLQRVVFPTDHDSDVLALYVDPDRAVLDADQATLGSGRGKVVQLGGTAEAEQDVSAVLGRRRYEVRRRQRISFGTYFNGFPASYWRRWTIVDQVRLEVSLSGRDATVVVYSSKPDGRSQRVASEFVDESGEGTFTFDLPLTPFADGGWYWFDVVAGEEAAVLEGAEWTAEVPASHAQSGTVSVGITTMNRVDFVTELVGQIAGDADVDHVLDRIYLVDQGSKPVKGDPRFEAAQKALGDKLKLIEQGNIGGSGGYARSQYETLKADESTYMMCMDDDVVCEPESIVRSVTFGDLCRRPTIVGGHMFSLYSKARLHSFGEIINRYRFWWMSPPTVQNDWDFASRNLRSSRWLHRRIDVDFNGWFMCLIPTTVLREIGLSLPLFIKWDDSEYGVRAAEAGYPTVTLPGSAVWHVPWTDKNDALDWQAYFHQRNRFIAALLHSPYDRGGRMVRESFNHQVKHLLAHQYSTAELRHRALEDVLAGPERLHEEIGTKLPEIRELRSRYSDAQADQDPDAFPDVRRKRPPKRGADPTEPKGPLGQTLAAVKTAVRQAKPPRALSRKYPEARLAAMDAKWWMIAQFDSVVVSMPDGTSSAWLRRDKEEVRSLMTRTVEMHQRLLREWPELARRYQAAMPELVSPERWETTFAASTSEEKR
jgi:galactofuranosylgalactofuranosylrhamnosyl-N-acetylglucosaminyl-diphospho-decaprenol beta-1,5/1,6-galactofuranosyltransferase